jgi:hypothetical protein
MVTRRWTMNCNLDYYVRTGETEPKILLRLAYKERSGAVTNVGTFRLDLVALAQEDVVTSRLADGREVFDIKIVRRGGTYRLQVREGASLPLSRFARTR